MGEVLPLLWIFGILPLGIGGGKNGTGIRINDLLPFLFSLSDFDSGLEHASDSGAVSSTTNDCLARHSFVL